MSIKLVDDSKLSAIGSSIRTTGGTQALLTLDEMPAAIEALGGGGGGGFDWSQLRNIRFKSALTSIDFDGLDTSEMPFLESMFNACTHLTSIDLSELDTSFAGSVSGLCTGCTNLTSLNLSSNDLSNVTICDNIVYRCFNLTSIAFPSTSTIYPSSMNSMFYQCYNLTNLDLSMFDTRNCTGFTNMFNACSGLKSVNFAKIDTRSISSTYAMYNMFGNCNAMEALIWGTDQSSVIALPVDPTATSNGYMPPNANIYVPDALVNDYKAATNWSLIASRIYGISNLPQAYKTIYGIS